MTWFEIRPQDVWLFRDGKPFAAGEDYSAHSMFPPTPLTVQGALRQKISMSLGVSLWQYKSASKGATSTQTAQDAVTYIGRHGELLDVGKFSLRGPFVSLRTDSGVVPLFPAPADLLKHNTSHKFRISKPHQTISSDLESSFLFPKVEAIENYENLLGYWMTTDTFQTYLDGVAPNDDVFHDISSHQDQDKDALTAYEAGKRIWHNELIYQHDNRFGVSTDALTSFREEGLLYQVQFIRPQRNIGLLVAVNNEIPTDLLKGAMSIGGEQRQAYATLVENVVMPSRSLSTCFKVVFLTPAYFDGGWQPKDGNWSTVFNHSVTLKSAVLYRPLKIGGWDSAKNRARTMYNYVAPGSVYYFEAEGTFSPPEVLTHNPDGINAHALGFGQYALGQW